MAGAKHFAATPLGRAVSAAIICEPEQNELCLEQKGVLWARVTVHGRMAHGAMPYAGVNPIAAAGQLLARLPQLERRLRRGVPRSRFLGVPHVTPTVVQGPVGHVAQNNVIPATAELRLDVRLTPGLEPGGVLGRHRGAGTGHGAAVPRHADHRSRPSRRPGRRRASSAARRSSRRSSGRCGGRAGGGRSSAACRARRTARSCAPSLGIPIVTFGPGNRLIPHQVDEHVPVDRARGSDPLLRRRRGAVSLASWLSPPRPRSSVRSRPSRPKVEDREVVCLRDPTGLTQSVLTVPRTPGARSSPSSTAPRSLVDVQGRSCASAARWCPRSQLESMLEILDQHLFLEGPRVDAERARQRAAFLAAPTAAGLPGRPLLRGEPGGLSASSSRRTSRRRAGRDRSARRATSDPWPRGAAHRLHPRRPGLRVGVPRPRRGPRRGLLHRPGHGPLGPRRPPASRRPAKAFETPFGPLDVDREVLDAVARRAPDDLFAAELAHRGEHSVEFQAVWLRYLRIARAGERAASCRSSRASSTSACFTARAPTASRPSRGCSTPSGDAMATVSRRYCIVAGADLAHVGPRYGDEWRAGRDPARARPSPRTACSSRRWSGAMPTGSSRRRSDSKTGTGSAACRRSMRSSACSPARKVGSSTTGSGPTPTARSRSPVSAFEQEAAPR